MKAVIWCLFREWDGIIAMEGSSNSEKALGSKLLLIIIKNKKYSTDFLIRM